MKQTSILPFVPAPCLIRDKVRKESEQEFTVTAPKQRLTRSGM